MLDKPAAVALYKGVFSPDSRTIIRSMRLPFFALVVVLALLSACEKEKPPPAPTPSRVGAAIGWQELPDWNQDKHAEAWPAFLQSCRVLPKKHPEMQAVCDAARQLHTPGDAQARAFFERWFEPHPVLAGNDNPDGLITGYYEPLLFGSFSKTGRYQYPLYQQPDDLLVIKLDQLFPELKGKRVRGRLQGNTVVPYFDRAHIEQQPSPLQGQELLWVDDPVDAFFLQIQGSGRVQLPDGSIVGVGYANQNGHPYRSIGNKLIQIGAFDKSEVSLFTIKQWLADHPERADEVLNSNPSYVFFSLRKDADKGPLGSLGVPLTPQRSIAIDRTRLPMGMPMWLSTSLPGDSYRAFNKLVMAQDTGGAIRGQVRADLFFGTGERAEKLAGGMKQTGRLYVLLPKNQK